MGNRIARLLAVLSVVLQVFLPASMAFAGAGGLDAKAFICAQPGNPSPGAEAAAKLFADLIDGSASDRSFWNGHCPLCALANAQLVPEPVSVSALVHVRSSAQYFIFRVDDLEETQGPPVGARGPPAHS
ncbi:DUF2946 family protein [Hwanghaeella grinnelliae]|uniref:DUF2946 family protein n=1 Tax=Hwanghaeella grinnelliae TaxID=2500179 RepID=UPI0013874343|nr:DUF2946 family protein [Hwanghaeella grinnelliae]